MPFGITNAPTIFQRMVNALVGDLEGVSAYIDDIIVYTKDMATHRTTLQELFRRLDHFRLKANRQKCEFGKKSIDIFGFRVSGAKYNLALSASKPSPT